MRTLPDQLFEVAISLRHLTSQKSVYRECNLIARTNSIPQRTFVQFETPISSNRYWSKFYKIYGSCRYHILFVYLEMTECIDRVISYGTTEYREKNKKLNLIGNYDTNKQNYRKIICSYGRGCTHLHDMQVKIHNN